MTEQMLVNLSALLMALALWLRIWRRSWSTFALVLFAFLTAPAVAHGCDRTSVCDAAMLLAALLPVAAMVRATLKRDDDHLFPGGVR